MKDILGKALLDYQNGNYTVNIKTSTNISDEDDLPLPHLFRDFKAMPKIEQKALALAKGRILDVGCGAGIHSLFLQNQGYKVTGIDISAGAVMVANQRGVKNAQLKNLVEVEDKYDTILMLMNGTGIIQELKNVPFYLQHLKSILDKNGQILIDSSDIEYMYKDEDGGLWVNTNAEYYGELEYFLSYKGVEEVPMKWLYLDFETLERACNANRLKCELILEGEHYDYLARITHST